MILTHSNTPSARTVAGLAARLALTLILLFPLAAQAQDAVGRIIQTEGSVLAIDAAGGERPLARGSEFFAGETITTGVGATVLLRFADGARMTIQGDSAFQVNEYQYDGEGGAPDSVIMTMLQGSMRTVSGTIGEGAGDVYELQTPFASMGIRGTEYGVTVEIGGRTFFVVFDGAISVQPSGGGGPVNMGVDGTTDALQLDDEDTVIEIPVESAPQTIQQLAQLIVAQIPQETLDTLPAPAEADATARQQAQQAAAVAAVVAQLTGTQDQQGAGGSFVTTDENGNPRTVQVLTPDDLEEIFPVSPN